MSDLSRLLDDVYRTTPAAAGATWSGQTLDEVLTNWVPAAETPSEPEPTVDEPELVVRPACELDAPTVAVEPKPEPRPPRPVTAPQRGWIPADDDILPAKAIRRRFGRRR